MPLWWRYIVQGSRILSSFPARHTLYYTIIMKLVLSWEWDCTLLFSSVTKNVALKKWSALWGSRAALNTHLAMLASTIMQQKPSHQSWNEQESDDNCKKTFKFLCKEGKCESNHTVQSNICDLKVQISIYY